MNCEHSKFWPLASYGLLPFFRPYMVLHRLHFLRYPLEISIFTHIVHFHRLYIAPMTLTLSFMIRYLNILSKATNIISLAVIFCQLLGVKQSCPGMKCNIEKKSFLHNITPNAA